VGADPNFFGSTYSVSKGVSDVLLKNKPNTLLFRVRLPFDNSRDPKNLLEKLYNYSKSGKLIEGGENSITDIDEAVKTAAELIDKDLRGVYNLVQWGPITNKKIAEMMGLEAEWFTPDEFAQVTFAKRSNCVIPAYERATPVEVSLEKAIAKFKEKL
jgi:NAD dependent epimerase/dehydratase family enzyme